MKQIYEYGTLTNAAWNLAARCVAAAICRADKHYIYYHCRISSVSQYTRTTCIFVSRCLANVSCRIRKLARISNRYSCRGMLPRVWDILASQFRQAAAVLLYFARIFCLHRFAWIGIRYVCSFRLQGCSRTSMVHTGILCVLVPDRTRHHLLRIPDTQLAYTLPTKQLSHESRSALEVPSARGTAAKHSAEIAGPLALLAGIAAVPRIHLCRILCNVAVRRNGPHSRKVHHNPGCCRPDAGVCHGPHSADSVGLCRSWHCGLCRDAFPASLSAFPASIPDIVRPGRAVSRVLHPAALAVGESSSLAVAMRSFLSRNACREVSA